jgi:hypothetical protein
MRVRLRLCELLLVGHHHFVNLFSFNMLRVFLSRFLPILHGCVGPSYRPLFNAAQGHWDKDCMCTTIGGDNALYILWP